ncbi:divergent PAP2 family protein [Candidatus Parcubacteria bacterium]|nr:MAG: divergent PAP2 family protein [Candidatus Parcubacteria bacterium]
MEYKLFLIPIIVMLLNQAIKVMVEAWRGNWTWMSVFSYGGMPSSHASIVVSLATVIGYYQGINSPEFAIAIILALLTMRDATGIRWHMGKQGKAINRLIKELPDNTEYKYPVLSERFGHKNTEVAVGIVVGLVLTAAIIKLWP